MIKKFLLWTNYPTLVQKVTNCFEARSFPSHTHIPLKNVQSRSFSTRSSHFRDQNTDFCFKVGTMPRGTLQSTAGVHGCSVPAGAVSEGALSCWCPWVQGVPADAVPTLSWAQLLNTPVPGFSAAWAVTKSMHDFMVSSACSPRGCTNDGMLTYSDKCIVPFVLFMFIKALRCHHPLQRKWINE